MYSACSWLPISAGHSLFPGMCFSLLTSEQLFHAFAHLPSSLSPTCLLTPCPDKMESICCNPLWFPIPAYTHGIFSQAGGTFFLQDSASASSASWGQEKETGVPLLVWNFNRCLCLTLYIRVQVFELSIWKLSCSPTFPEGDYDVNSSFFLSDKYICGQEDARTPLQKLWSAVGWDKSYFGNQETWTQALEICLNPDFWPQECH